MTDKQPNPQSDNLKPDEQEPQVAKPAESAASTPPENGTPAVKPAEPTVPPSQASAKPEEVKSTASTTPESKPDSPASDQDKTLPEKLPTPMPTTAPIHPKNTPAEADDIQSSTNKIPDDVVAAVVKREPTSAAPQAPVEAKPPTKAESTAPKPAAESAPPAKVDDKSEAPKAAPTTQTCPNCNHANRAGIIFCENCGTNLLTGKQPTLGTRDLMREQESSTTRTLDTKESVAVKNAGSGVFTEDMVLRIEIEGGLTPMLIYPKVEIIFGRRDPSSGNQPDVDLTSYAGYRMGVSRRHAALRLHENRLDVSDLGSSNGTFLNGQRLGAHQPYQVRDGDEIRLGQMVLKLFFQQSKS